MDQLKLAAEVDGLFNQVNDLFGHADFLWAPAADSKEKISPIIKGLGGLIANIGFFAERGGEHYGRRVKSYAVEVKRRLETLQDPQESGADRSGR